MVYVNYIHDPVMCSEVVDVLSEVPDGVLVDATVGGGGHSLALLRRHPGLCLVGIDQDRTALREAARRLRPFRNRVTLHHARFDRLGTLLDELQHHHISAALFDLGVSSAHFDDPERGFSYHLDGPLDMRMDRTRDGTAGEIVNCVGEHTLRSILRSNSDEAYAHRIAKAIVSRRPLRSTIELAEVVKASVPAAARRNGHPARRTFQALRIEVNDELRVLAPALKTALQRLQPFGRCAVLSYHSGEDRIVKKVFRQAAGVVGFSLLGPPPPTQSRAFVRLLWNGVRKPSETEKQANRRASSAHLRAVERLGEQEEG